MYDVVPLSPDALYTRFPPSVGRRARRDSHLAPVYIPLDPVPLAKAIHHDPIPTMDVKLPIFAALVRILPPPLAFCPTRTTDN